MILKTAWKNVWRNKVRSMVVIASVTIGIFGGIFIVAVMNGAIEQRVDAALNQELGHIQIQHEEFRDNYEMKLTLDSPELLREAALEHPGVEAVTSRIVVTGMANTAVKSTGVQVVGIYPEQEREIFRLHETTIEGTGSFFETESRFNQVYIGEELAKELQIIRYRVDEAVLDSLAADGVPESVLSKLKSLKDKRFSSESDFRKSFRSLADPDEVKQWGSTILQRAWSFSRRARLTLTFLDSDQMQTGAMFRIAGIFDTRNTMFEMGRVFVRHEDLARLAGIGDGAAHQMIIRVKDRDESKKIAAFLEEQFPGPEILTWKEIQPDLAMMTDMVEKFYAVFMVIILAALAFGIVNTMLMVVLERTKELGMLTAIGMNKKRVFSMIMLESVFLSLVGGVAGMLVSEAVIRATARRGINFASYEDGFEAFGVSAHIYPDISLTFFVTVTILIVVTGILSSVYPALKALRLDPADALRTE